MTVKRSLGQRAMSIFLSVALLTTMLPLSILSASVAGADGFRVADPSTMDGWKKFFPTAGDISTENAGGVWMDKSVFTDASAFAHTGITQDGADSFLVALSAMAANMSITGMSNVPTDTILVLDVSGSMNDNQGNNDVAEELVAAANASIKTLLDTNSFNRVGVVLYSGSSSSTTNYSTAAVLLLPLGRYDAGADGQYLNYSVTGNRETTETVSLDSDVVYEGTTDAPAAQSKTVVGATYIQRGVITAMNEFVAADNEVTVNDSVHGTMNRKPVLVLMSDGAPTLGSTEFTDPGYNQDNGFNLGDGKDTSAALGFSSQLSASYAKAKIEEKYGSEALFYTLGLGISNNSVAIGVMDPDNAYANASLGDFWDLYDAAAVGSSVTVQSGGWWTPSRSVTKVETAMEENYVDEYFAADGASGSLADELSKAFENIVGAIQLQSGYFPTLVSENEDLSGYISFVDKIGEYMEVTDVKGILIDGKLFSGADLASNFVADGGALGTYTEPTALGFEMVSAVRARLGLASDDDARTLIGLAYENGQLSYTDADNYSNYIGWYANAQGKFLGFYNEGTTVLPAAAGNAETDPAFLVKSYGYLGAVDESHGVSKSDMMYATVQVREEIATGEQLVTFAIPAALIPTVTYNVTLSERGTLSDLTVSGADNPIRLVYELALNDEINSFNVKEIVSAEYLADEHNVNDDGSINFYTNRWDHANTTGYGTINTYSYFNPSRQNDKYYYLEDATVYADADGTEYTGAQPSDNVTLYRRYPVYKNNGSLRTETVYRELSDAAKATAQQRGDGTWYIPKGNVHVNLDGYTIDKTENETGTLGHSYIPFVDTHDHTVGDSGYNYYVGATLGNNGKYTVVPQTGIKLTKAMADGAAAPAGAFDFTITNETDPADSSSYPGYLILANGREMNTQIKFTDGSAAVQLNPGDILYIGGMTANETFRIVEKETIEYIANAAGLSDAGTVTVNEKEIKPVAFVNEDRGEGHLTIAKEVKHDFGVDYQIPADKVFTMDVTLKGIGTANAAFEAKHTNGTYTNIATDENGHFTVQLRHDERFEIFGLPHGTEVTVVEQAPAAGFIPAYWDNGAVGDGKVTVMKNNIVSVVVINDYTAQTVSPVNISLGGEKVVKDENGNVVDEWNDDYNFTIVLERFGENGWEKVEEKVLHAGQKAFTFDMSEEEYDAPGVYSYQIYEAEPELDDSGRVNGMIYDLAWHTFSVYVSDEDMDGRLEIVRVHSEHADKNFEPDANGVYNLRLDFENTQTVTVPALATIEIQKVLNNNAGSPLVSLAGYSFGLYTDASCTTEAVVGNGVKTISLNPTDAVGEGWIDIQFDKTGEYIFYVKEIAGGVNQMSYSEQIIKVIIHVADGEESGSLVAAVDYFTADGSVYALGDDAEVEYTNTYDPADTTLAIDFVSKEITGRGLNAGEFAFEVRALDGSPVLTGTNNAQGDVIFNGTLSFDKVGRSFYDIVETSADGKGVVTDKTAYRMVVTVTDVNGQLTADYVLLNVSGDEITFKNSYTAAPVDNAIDGTKALRGRTLINDEFTFVLTELTADGAAVQNPSRWTTKNFSDGSFAFPALTYDKTGTYTYQVEEVVPNGGKAYGIAYDSAKYIVTVVVDDDGEGKLYIASESFAMLDGKPANALSFLNEYEAAPTSAQFTGDKTLTGKVNNALEGGEFGFVLYNSDADWTQGGEREKVQNGEGGVITFSKIDFTTADDQWFLIKEVNGGQTIDGVTYDDTVYRVWVEVTDDLKGQLHATVHIYDGAGVPQSSISFVNIYEVTGDATVTLSGEKIIDGRDWKTGDAFTFGLFTADENFNYTASGSSAVGAKTVRYGDEDYKFEFDLTYTPEDIGKTFYYVLIEDDSNPIKGLINSSAVYEIKVVVEDDNQGGVKTTATVENATTSTLNFVNKYTITTGESAQFTAAKELSGKTIGDIKFSFDLIESNASWASVKVLQTQENDGATITFDKIDYAAAGDYYYIVAEQKAGQTLGGITYDDTVYRIHVKVTDNLDSTLSKSVTIVKVEGGTETAVDAIAFVNTYSVTRTDSIELSGVKTIEGRGWTEADAFTFEIYAADESFKSLGAAPVKSAMADKTTGTFTLSMEYGVDDVGKTFYYVLKEKNAGQRIDGITYSGSEYKVTVTVKDRGDGTVKAEAAVDGAEINALNFTNSYTTDKAVVGFDGTKTLNTLSGIRQLKENDFTFDLYKANENFKIDGAPIQSKKNDVQGNFSFDDVEFTEEDTYYFVIKENSQNPIGGVVYDNTQYHITVVVTDNGKGKLEAKTTMLKVKGETSEATEGIAFVNDYNAAAVNVTLGGSKTLTGRAMVDGEFMFLLYKANSAFAIAEGESAMVALNADGSFTFDALSFTEAGAYYFVIMEDKAAPSKRMIFDDAVYYVTIEVTDDENGKLAASDPVIVKKGSTQEAEAITFTNVFIPKPADITVDINIHKTVVNKGADKIGPEGFAFLLKALADDMDGITVKSDADGKARFTLTFTENDVGKTFSYKLTEVNSGKYGVVYSTAAYAITIEISLDEETNTLVAALTQNEAAAAELIAEFENTYDADIPDNPQTGDNSTLAMWIALMFVSSGAAITLCVSDKKKRRQAKV